MISGWASHSEDAEMSSAKRWGFIAPLVRFTDMARLMALPDEGNTYHSSGSARGKTKPWTCWRDSQSKFSRKVLTMARPTGSTLEPSKA